MRAWLLKIPKFFRGLLFGRPILIGLLRS